MQTPLLTSSLLLVFTRNLSWANVGHLSAIIWNGSLQIVLSTGSVNESLCMCQPEGLISFTTRLYAAFLWSIVSDERECAQCQSDPSSTTCLYLYVPSYFLFRLIFVISIMVHSVFLVEQVTWILGHILSSAFIRLLLFNIASINKKILWPDFSAGNQRFSWLTVGRLGRWLSWACYKGLRTRVWIHHTHLKSRHGAMHLWPGAGSRGETRW